MCKKIHFNRCRFAVAVANCLGGSLFWGHSVKCGSQTICCFLAGPTIQHTRTSSQEVLLKTVNNFLLHSIITTRFTVVYKLMLASRLIIQHVYHAEIRNTFLWQNKQSRQKLTTVTRTQFQSSHLQSTTQLNYG